MPAAYPASVYTEAFQAVCLPAYFRDKLALSTTWLVHDKQVKEGRQESPDTLVLLACMHLKLSLLKQLILEVFLQRAPRWHRNAVGTVSGCWHSSCSAGKSLWQGQKGFTGKQLSREINTTVTHCLEQFWHFYSFCSPVFRRVGITFPQTPPSFGAMGTTADIDTGASPLATGTFTFSVGSKTPSLLTLPSNSQCDETWSGTAMLCRTFAHLPFRVLRPRQVLGSASPQGRQLRSQGPQLSPAAAPLNCWDRASSDFKPDAQEQD